MTNKTIEEYIKVIEDLQKANNTLKLNLQYEVDTFKYKLLQIIKKHDKDFIKVIESNNFDFVQVFYNNLMYDLKTLTNERI